jgi:pimeloyl-ACP methyl ester carboxylesterase
MDRWLLSITPILLKLYNFNALVNLTSNQIALTANGKKYALETLSGLSKEEVIHIMGAVYRGLIEFDKDKLACPVLITYGVADITGKVQAYCQRWAKTEDRPLKVISKAAHNANMDNPDEFNQILAEFLSSVPGK